MLIYLKILILLSLQTINIYCGNSEFVSRPNRTELNSIFDRTEHEPNTNRTLIEPSLVRFSSGSVRVRFGFGWVNSVWIGRDTNSEFPQYNLIHFRIFFCYVVKRYVYVTTFPELFRLEDSQKMIKNYRVICSCCKRCTGYDGNSEEEF